MTKLERIQEKIFEEIILNRKNPFHSKNKIITKIKENILLPRDENLEKEINKYCQENQNEKNNFYEKVNDGYFIGIAGLAGIATAAIIIGYYYLTL